MRIGERLFCYPVLNSNLNLSEYKKSSTFSLKFDVREDGSPIIEDGYLVFKNLHFELNNQELLGYIAAGRIKGTFIVECSASTYRANFPISSEPRDLSIELGNFSGNVSVSAYLYAAEDIEGYSNKDFDDVYVGRTFDIDKYDILVIDDGFKIQIIIDSTDDNKLSSIFTVIRVESDEKVMKAVPDTNKIKIYLSKEYYQAYEIFKGRSQYNNMSFAMMAIPALAESISYLKTFEFTEVEEIVNGMPWFNAVLKAYKKETGNEMTFDVFTDTPAIELAQIVLNHGTCNGIKDWSNSLLTFEEGSSDE